MARHVYNATIVDDASVDDLDAIAISAIAASALGDNQDAPGTIIDGARRNLLWNRSGTDQDKKSDAEEMTDHGSLMLGADTAQRARARTGIDEMLSPHISWWGKEQRYDPLEHTKIVETTGQVRERRTESG
jgi:hypothetical protein